jgi:hypothetical protein
MQPASPWCSRECGISDIREGSIRGDACRLLCRPASTWLRCATNGLRAVTWRGLARLVLQFNCARSLAICGRTSGSRPLPLPRPTRIDGLTSVDLIRLGHPIRKSQEQHAVAGLPLEVAYRVVAWSSSSLNLIAADWFTLKRATGSLSRAGPARVDEGGQGAAAGKFRFAQGISHLVPALAQSWQVCNLPCLRWAVAG